MGAGAGHATPVAEMTIKGIPPNMLVVSFGLPGLINPIFVQDWVRSISRFDEGEREGEAMLQDPIKNYDDIVSRVNSKLSIYNTTIPVFLSHGRMLDFRATPFLFVPEFGSVCISGLYDLESLSKFVDPIGFSALSDAVASPEKIRTTVFEKAGRRAILPTSDDLGRLENKEHSLAEWSSIFSNEPYMITTEKLIELAMRTPHKLHIFYLAACRTPEFVSNLSAERAKTRSATDAAFSAVLDARGFERVETERIKAFESVAKLCPSEASCTIAGGSRRKRHRKRRIQKKRCVTKRKRIF